jgi:hypothetical protein
MQLLNNDNLVAHRDDNGVLLDGLIDGELYAVWQHVVFPGLSRNHNYTAVERSSLYRDFKDAYMMGTAGMWYLNNFRSHGF